MSQLPFFEYFPEPLDPAQHRFEQSEQVCVCCGRVRGWVYEEPVIGWGNEPAPDEEPDQERRVCPWCIADESVQRRYPDHWFNSLASGAPDDVRLIVERRTPGIVSWQDIIWPTCCNDACVFVGQAQHDRLTRDWPEAGLALRKTYEQESGWLDTRTFEEFLEYFKSQCDPAAYVFRCRHCGKWEVQWDIS